jgi:hypothetical protein
MLLPALLEKTVKFLKLMWRVVGMRHSDWLVEFVKMRRNGCFYSVYCKTIGAQYVR